MTEPEWLAATDPVLIYSHVHSTAPDRKLRLFAAGCCRLFWTTLPLTAARMAIESNEAFADGLITDEQRGQTQVQVGILADMFSTDTRQRRPRDRVQRQHQYAARLSLVQLAMGPARLIRTELVSQLSTDPLLMEIGPALLRCIFGNPFRPVVFDPSWLTETAVTLATGIYADRAFDRLPILADALEEAGCDHPDVLTHCRQPGPHARGCWVVDGVLA